MAPRLGRWQTWLLALSLACGGHTLGSPDREEGEKEPSEGSGGGNQEGGRPASQAGRPAVMGGGTASVPVGGRPPSVAGQPGLPTAGAPGAPDCVGDPNESCVPGCGREVDSVSTPICYQGRWRCSLSYVPLSSCAPDSCALVSGECCDSISGHLHHRECLPDGKRAECPPELDPYDSGGYCSPNYQICTEGQSCPALGAECHFRRGSCTCEDHDAGPIWSCRFLLI
jgi:hypothetical protein